MKRKMLTRAVAVLAVLAMIGTLGFTPATSAAPVPADAVDFERSGPPQGWYVRYDGIDGESFDADHEAWIDLLAMSWTADQGDTTATSRGASRRAGAVNVNDMVLTFEYEKASPKVLEAMLTGRVIPKLEIEMETFGAEDGGSTYLRYELTNVLVTSYDVGGASDDGPPLVTASNSFEEIKVTYTGRDARGKPTGEVETTYNVGRGK